MLETRGNLNIVSSSLNQPSQSSTEPNDSRINPPHHNTVSNWHNDAPRNSTRRWVRSSLLNDHCIHESERKMKLLERGREKNCAVRGIIWRGTCDDTDQRWAKGSRCMANIMQSSACNDRGTMAGETFLLLLVFVRRAFSSWPWAVCNSRWRVKLACCRQKRGGEARL